MNEEAQQHLATESAAEAYAAEASGNPFIRLLVDRVNKAASHSEEEQRIVGELLAAAREIEERQRARPAMSEKMAEVVKSLASIIEGGTLVWAWIPDRSEFKEFDDVAKAYAIVRHSEAAEGVVIFARWQQHWEANPWTARPVVRRMLNLCGGETWAGG